MVAGGGEGGGQHVAGLAGGDAVNYPAEGLGGAGGCVAGDVAGLDAGGTHEAHRGSGGGADVDVVDIEAVLVVGVVVDGHVFGGGGQREDNLSPCGGGVGIAGQHVGEVADGIAGGGGLHVEGVGGALGLVPELEVVGVVGVQDKLRGDEVLVVVARGGLAVAAEAEVVGAAVGGGVGVDAKLVVVARVGGGHGPAVVKAVLEVLGEGEGGDGGAVVDHHIARVDEVAVLVAGGEDDGVAATGGVVDDGGGGGAAGNGTEGGSPAVGHAGLVALNICGGKGGGVAGGGGGGAADGEDRERSGADLYVIEEQGVGVDVGDVQESHADGLATVAGERGGVHHISAGVGVAAGDGLGEDGVGEVAGSGAGRGDEHFVFAVGGLVGTASDIPGDEDAAGVCRHGDGRGDGPLVGSGALIVAAGDVVGAGVGVIGRGGKTEVVGGVVVAVDEHPAFVAVLKALLPRQGADGVADVDLGGEALGGAAGSVGGSDGDGLAAGGVPHGQGGVAVAARVVGSDVPVEAGGVGAGSGEGDGVAGLDAARAVDGHCGCGGGVGVAGGADHPGVGEAAIVSDGGPCGAIEGDVGAVLIGLVVHGGGGVVDAGLVEGDPQILALCDGQRCGEGYSLPGSLLGGGGGDGLGVGRRAAGVAGVDVEGVVACALLSDVELHGGEVVAAYQCGGLNLNAPVDGSTGTHCGVVVLIETVGHCLVPCRVALRTVLGAVLGGLNVTERDAFHGAGGGLCHGAAGEQHHSCQSE